MISYDARARHIDKEGNIEDYLSWIIRATQLAEDAGTGSGASVESVIVRGKILKFLPATS